MIHPLFSPGKEFDEDVFMKDIAQALEYGAASLYLDLTGLDADAAANLLRNIKDKGYPVLGVKASAGVDLAGFNPVITHELGSPLPVFRQTDVIDLRIPDWIIDDPEKVRAALAALPAQNVMLIPATMSTRLQTNCRACWTTACWHLFSG